MNDQELIKFVVEHRHALADLVAFVDKHEESKLSFHLAKGIKSMTLSASDRLSLYNNLESRPEPEGGFRTIATSC